MAAQQDWLIMKKTNFYKKLTVTQACSSKSIDIENYCYFEPLEERTQKF